MQTDVITIEQVGPVVVATFNRPDTLNSSGPELHGRLATIWTDLAGIPDARAVVLTGAGRAFSAGGDLDLLQRMVVSEETRDHVMWEAEQVVRGIVDFPLPLIAAVNGPAVGLGASLAGLADLVVMAQDAFFADPHVSLGLVAGDGSVLSWPQHMGLQRAKEWILLGGRISADEAHRIGIANRVVPSGEALQAAIDLAQRVATLPPQAVRETLRALNKPLRARLTDDLPEVLAAEKASFLEASFQKNLARMLERSKG